MENRWSTGHCCHLLCKWYMYVPYNSYIVVTSHFNVCFALIKCTENYNHNLKRLFTLFTCKKATWLKYWGMKNIKILNLYSILLYTELIATNKYFSLKLKNFAEAPLLWFSQVSQYMDQHFKQEGQLSLRWSAPISCYGH